MPEEGRYMNHLYAHEGLYYTRAGSKLLRAGHWWGSIYAGTAT